MSRWVDALGRFQNPIAFSLPKGFWSSHLRLNDVTARDVVQATVTEAKSYEPVLFLVTKKVGDAYFEVVGSAAFSWTIWSAPSFSETRWRSPTLHEAGWTGASLEEYNVRRGLATEMYSIRSFHIDWYSLTVSRDAGFYQPFFLMSRACSIQCFSIPEVFSSATALYSSRLSSFILVLLYSWVILTLLLCVNNHLRTSGGTVPRQMIISFGYLTAALGKTIKRRVKGWFVFTLRRPIAAMDNSKSVKCGCNSTTCNFVAKLELVLLHVTLPASLPTLQLRRILEVLPYRSLELLK